MISDKKTVFEILENEEEAYTTLNRLVYDICSTKESSIKDERTHTYLFRQKQGLFKWKDTDEKRNENVNEPFYRMIGNIEKMFTALNIRYSVSKQKRLQSQTIDERWFYVDVIISYEVYADQYKELQDLMQEFEFWRLGKISEGWMDRMEKSEFTRILANEIYETFRSEKNGEFSGTSYVRFSVNRDSLVIENIGGRNVFKHIIYKDHGYKPLPEYPQRKGVEGALMKILIEQFSQLGTRYVKAAPIENSCLISLYFSDKDKDAGLKDW